MPRLVRLAAADEIPAGGGKAIEVDGRLLAVFNAGGGRYYASSPLCPHEDGPLADGVVEGPADRPSSSARGTPSTSTCAAAPARSIRT